MTTVQTEQIRKMVKYLIENFASIEWKKIPTTVWRYEYVTDINGLHIRVNGQYLETLARKHYVRIGISSENAELVAYDGEYEDNVDELLELERLLGEEEAWCRGEKSIIDKIDEIVSGKC